MANTNFEKYKSDGSLQGNLLPYEGCRSFFLARYFGEQRQGRCGHCSWCLS